MTCDCVADGSGGGARRGHRVEWRICGRGDTRRLSQLQPLMPHLPQAPTLIPHQILLEGAVE